MHRDEERSYIRLIVVCQNVFPPRFLLFYAAEKIFDNFLKKIKQMFAFLNKMW